MGRGSVTGVLRLDACLLTGLHIYPTILDTLCTYLSSTLENRAEQQQGSAATAQHGSEDRRRRLDGGQVSATPLPHAPPAVEHPMYPAYAAWVPMYPAYAAWVVSSNDFCGSLASVASLRK